METCQANNTTFFLSDISKVPEKKWDLYLWADWIEFNCIEHQDGVVNCKDTVLEYWYPNGGMASDFLQPGEDDVSEQIDEPKDEHRLSRIEKEDARVRDLIKYLSMRATMLGDNYPFEINPTDVIIIRKDELLSNHVLYIFLLFAANLRLFTKPDSGELATDFERISVYALRTMLSNKSIIKHFGTANHPGFEGYSGNKEEKLESLAHDIDTTLRAEGINPRDRADAGIDIVAWYPFDDGAPFMPVYFAQSGCTADEMSMLYKQDEVTPSRMVNLFDRIWPINLMFTPACYRNASGAWVKPHELRSFFIDRIRLLKLLDHTLTEEEKAHMPSLDKTKNTLLNLDIFLAPNL